MYRILSCVLFLILILIQVHGLSHTIDNTVKKETHESQNCLICEVLVHTLALKPVGLLIPKGQSYLKLSSYTNPLFSFQLHFLTHLRSRAPPVGLTFS